MAGDLTVPDPEMVAMELETLRVLNGEDAPGFIGGAGALACCAWLKARGYAKGLYEISDKGKAYLQALSQDPHHD